jgi:hypothetical protein
VCVQWMLNVAERAEIVPAIRRDRAATITST